MLVSVCPAGYTRTQLHVLLFNNNKATCHAVITTLHTAHAAEICPKAMNDAVSVCHSNTQQKKQLLS